MVFNPSAPAGSWFTPTGGYTAPTTYAGSPYGSQPYTYQPAAPTQVHASGAPAAPTAAGGDIVSSQQWAQYQQQIQQLLQGAAGQGMEWQRQQLQAQMKDAEKARQNAIQLERMRDETSRYGVDQQRATAMAQLTENARQYDHNHELELQRFGLETKKVGLDYAGKATEYLSTPDRFFQAGNYLDMASRVFAGQPGAAPYGSTGSPTPKTEQDFAILAGGGVPSAGRGSAGMPSVGAGTNGPLGQTAEGRSVGGESQPSAGTDERVRVVAALTKALPPSAGDGLDPTDFAVLGAVNQLYKRNLRPGEYQTIASNPDYLGITRSGGARLGYNPDAWQAQQVKNLPGQQSVRAA